MVVTELRGEKVDIVPYTDVPTDFVMKALAPARVREVRIHEDTGTAEVIVPDFQLSLAIGKEGQNARLAARLTGVRVDIRGETQHREAPDEADYAEGEWVENAEGVMEFRAADGSVISAAEWNEGVATEPVADAEPAAEPAPAEPGSSGDAEVTTQAEEVGDEANS